MYRIKIALVVALAIISSNLLAQNESIEINERQIFIPLLEIEDFVELTPEKMDEMLPSLQFPIVKKDGYGGSKHYILDLRDKNYTFLGRKLCECETYFSTSYNPQNRITSNSARIEFSASSDEEALSEFKRLADLLTKSKLIKTKVKLDPMPKDGLLEGDIYKTSPFIMTADTYASRHCYMKLSTNTPNLKNSMAVGVVNKLYTVEFGIYTIFYRNGKEWVCLGKPYWKETGKYLK